MDYYMVPIVDIVYEQHATAVHVSREAVCWLTCMIALITLLVSMAVWLKK